MMILNKPLYFAIFINLAFLLAYVNASRSEQNYVFPCYYVYEPQVLKPESIPAFNLCTHIIILGCVTENFNPTYVSYSVKPYDCSIVFSRLTALKKANPNLKIIASMATNANLMHLIVQNDESIYNFTSSAIELAIKFDLDGIDLDWEYPCDGTDRFRFTQLLANLRYLIDNEYKMDLELTAAIGAPLDVLSKCYDLDGLSKYLDYINIMCYDYNTIYNNYTAYASPLYQRPEEKGYDATLNTNFTVHYLIENNVPRNKIVLGLNAGGHTFQLKDPNQHGFHAPVLGTGYSAGWSLYPQLCQFIKTGDGIGVYDEIAEVLYGYYDDQWSNTGDVRSAIAKANWAKKMNLAGVFTWCLNWDDLLNVCGHNESFPIHRAINRVLFK